MSSEHVPSEEMKEIRTSGNFLTFVNLLKSQIGIGSLCFARFVGDSGVAASIVGVVLQGFFNIYCVWLLIKARNRFKKDKIATLNDLGYKLFGTEGSVANVLIFCV